MKFLTYNVMEGGVKPDPSRLEKVLRVISGQNADILGLQETKATPGEGNELVWAMRNAHTYHYDVVFDCHEEWAYGSGTSLFSKITPSSSRIVGEKTRAVEMMFPTRIGDLSVCNVYFSHVSERERLPQAKEMLQELQGNNYSIIMGDFNALSPEDNIPQNAVNSFSGRMKEKYCREEKLCYDTIEAVLNAGYVDIGLKFHRPEEITDKTDLSGGTGKHTLPVRIDFIFAKKEVLPYVKEFTLVGKGLARTASDHFPLYVIMDEMLMGS